MFDSIFKALDTSNTGLEFDSLWESFLSSNEKFIGSLISHKISLGLNPQDALKSFGILAFQVKNLKHLKDALGNSLYTGINGGGIIIPGQKGVTVKTDGAKVLYFLKPSSDGSIKYDLIDYSYEEIRGEKYSRVIQFGVPITPKELNKCQGKTLTFLSLIEFKEDAVGNICTPRDKPSFRKVWYNVTTLKTEWYTDPVFLPGLSETIVLEDTNTTTPIDSGKVVIKTTSQLKGKKLKAIIQKKWLGVDLPDDWETLSHPEKEIFVDSFISSLDEDLKESFPPNLRVKYLDWKRVLVDLPPTAESIPCLTPTPEELDESSSSFDSFVNDYLT